MFTQNYIQINVFEIILKDNLHNTEYTNNLIRINVSEIILKDNLDNTEYITCRDAQDKTDNILLHCEV